MFFDEFLAAADDGLLVSCLNLTEEVDGRDATLPGMNGYVGIRVSSEIAVEQENGSEEEERYQSEGVSGVAPEEGHGVG